MVNKGVDTWLGSAASSSLLPESMRGTKESAQRRYAASKGITCISQNNYNSSYSKGYKELDDSHFVI